MHVNLHQTQKPEPRNAIAAVSKKLKAKIICNRIIGLIMSNGCPFRNGQSPFFLRMVLGSL